MFNFPLIASPEILRIPINENGERLIDVKADNLIAYGDIPETPLTKDDYTLMRETVYKKLLKAQSRLPEGLRIRLYEGYRSLTVQKQLFDYEKQRVTEKHPELKGRALFDKITEVVSPVINFDGSKNIPPHNTGAAIDVEIIDDSGKCLDMGMEAKDWQQVSHKLCLTNSPLITKQQKANRALLYNVMVKEGFVNYPTEWWHFSYGDRYWAYYQKTPLAIYGAV